MNDDKLSEDDMILAASVYQSIETRRIAYDNLIWQTPALGLTAQAFLFTLALSHDSSKTARLTATSLAFVVSVLSMHLMMKHRHHESIDSRLLADMDDKYHLGALHSGMDDRAKDAGVKRNWRHRLSAYLVWMVGLGIFAVAAAFIAVVTLTCPNLL
jgi:uncharacterized membrane protein